MFTSRILLVMLSVVSSVCCAGRVRINLILVADVRGRGQTGKISIGSVLGRTGFLSRSLSPKHLHNYNSR